MWAVGLLMRLVQSQMQKCSALGGVSPDIAFAAAAPVPGAILDHGLSRAVFADANLASVMGIACAGLVGQEVSRRIAAAAT